MIRKLLHLIVYMSTLAWTGCDVHEWPELPERVGFHLRLEYDTDMPKLEYAYDARALSATHGYGMRYIVRAYPLSDDGKTSSDYIEELIFSREVSEGYDCEVDWELPAGQYNIMVWSDLTETGSTVARHYDADNFSEVRLNGEHAANTDLRDAFRGTGTITFTASIMETPPDTLVVGMVRPLAKFEFITTDLAEFIDKERRLAMARNPEQEEESRSINVEDYKVMFYYVGFMPDAFSLFTDKPVDSSTGVCFESGLTAISETEASMGFDYVFVNGKESAVTVQIGIYNKDGEQLSMTEPIEVPLKRSRHTVMRGMFLMSETSGGVTIDPEYDGDYNLIYP